jgi:hypothetical protein
MPFEEPPHWLAILVAYAPFLFQIVPRIIKGRDVPNSNSLHYSRPAQVSGVNREVCPTDFCRLSRPANSFLTTAGPGSSCSQSLVHRHSNFSLFHFQHSQRTNPIHRFLSTQAMFQSDQFVYTLSDRCRVLDSYRQRLLCSCRLPFSFKKASLSRKSMRTKSIVISI